VKDARIEKMLALCSQFPGQIKSEEAMQASHIDDRF
jgi:hypothetical protein